MDQQAHAAHSDDLNAFVDEFLGPDERARLQSRLAQDPAMERELAELQAAARLMRHLPEFTPRRSFRLGDEFAKASPSPPPGKILYFLPFVRTLSVAAALVFMVVAGSLFFDMNGNTESDSGATFQEQNEILGHPGETETGAGSSDEAEDAGGESASGDESSMTSRGDAASVGDDPMEDLTAIEDSGDDIAQSTTSNAVGSPVVSSDDDDRSAWIWSSVLFGGLALVLAGLWFVLAKVGRQSPAGHS